VALTQHEDVVIDRFGLLFNGRHDALVRQLLRIWGRYRRKPRWYRMRDGCSGDLTFHAADGAVCRNPPAVAAVSAYIGITR